MPVVVHDLTVAYHKKPVLWGIDLAVPHGKLVGIVGPNGAGKSTLIKASLGLLPWSSGWVRVFGRPVRQNLRRVGYVPQRESVDWDFPVSVLDVVLMGRYGRLGLVRRPGRADREVARGVGERGRREGEGDQHDRDGVAAREVGGAGEGGAEAGLELLVHPPSLLPPQGRGPGGRPIQ